MRSSDLNLRSGSEERDFHVWIDPRNPVLANNVRVGIFTSNIASHNGVDYIPLSTPENLLPFVENPQPTQFTWSISPFVENVIHNYRVEHNFEVMRMRRFSQYPSRLQALFLFETESEAYRYRERVPDRILKRVKTVGDYGYSLHDLSWIDFARFSPNLDEWSAVIGAYWIGQQTIDSQLESWGEPWAKESITEVLFLGTVEFYDKTL